MCVRYIFFSAKASVFGFSVTGRPRELARYLFTENPFIHRDQKVNVKNVKPGYHSYKSPFSFLWNHPIRVQDLALCQHLATETHL